MRQLIVADICVTYIAIPSPPLAPKAEPALKPNHPTHNIEAPIIVSIGLCGGVIDFGKPLLLLSVSAVTKAAVTAVACTTMPPAKSIVAKMTKYRLPKPNALREHIQLKPKGLKKLTLLKT